MTQREKNQVTAYQRDALYTYCLFCISQDDTPKKETIGLIYGCTDIKRLKETIEIFKSKTGNPKTEQSR